MFNQSVTLLIITSFLIIISGLFVLYKNPRKRVNISFALMALMNLIWINSNYFEDEFKDPKIMSLLLKIDFSSGIFFVFFILLFCLDIAKLKVKIIKSVYFRALLFAIPTIITCLVFFTKFVISGYEIIHDGVINPLFGFGGIIYDILVVIVPLMGIFLIAFKYRQSEDREKSKYIYLFIGFFLAIMSAILTNVIWADYLKTSSNCNLYSRFGAFSTIFLVLFSGYAIIKHHLLDIRIIATELLSLGILVLNLFQILTANSTLELIINSTVFVFLLIFIVMLVRSINSEAQRKNELQMMADKLSQANDQLKKLDNAKSEFISIASHQLRTPLTAVKGFISLILEGSYGDLNPEARSAINRIYLSNERLIRLVEDLLNISRIESGRMEYKFSYWQIEDIIKELADSFFVAARKKKLGLKLELPRNTLPKVKMDGLKVKEVISNLIDNALKYTRKGWIKVKAEQLGNKIRITVSDTGMGISKDELPFLFAKFSRGRNIKRLYVEGTGLGLYVGKSLIETHHGRIWAESDGEEKGSRFIIELPIDQDELTN